MDNDEKTLDEIITSEKGANNEQRKFRRNEGGNRFENRRQNGRNRKDFDNSDDGNNQRFSRRSRSPINKHLKYNQRSRDDSSNAAEEKWERGQFQNTTNSNGNSNRQKLQLTKRNEGTQLNLGSNNKNAPINLSTTGSTLGKHELIPQQSQWQTAPEKKSQKVLIRYLTLDLSMDEILRFAQGNHFKLDDILSVQATTVFKNKKFLIEVVIEYKDIQNAKDFKTEYHQATYDGEKIDISLID